MAEVMNPMALADYNFSSRFADFQLRREPHSELG